MRRLCREGFDALEGRTEFDFLGDLAARIPPMIIGELLGVPEADQEQLGRWVDMFMHYDPAAETGDTVQGIMQLNDIRLEGMRSMGAYMAALIDERRQQRQDDLLSLLLDAEVDLPDGTTRPLEPRRCTASSCCCRAPGARRPLDCSGGRRCSWRAIRSSGPSCSPIGR